MSLTIVLGALVLVGMLIRLIPVFSGWKNFGVDHWYWTAYVKGLRSQKKLPPSLPNYVLEEAQWYPPFFPLLLSWLPSALFEKYDYVIAVSVDLGRMVLLCVAMLALGVSSLTAIAIAGIFYATTPILACYNTQLNPRGLAAFFFDAAFVLIALSLRGRWPGDPFVVWGLIVFFSSLVLLTHKMNTQLLFFSLAGLSLYFRRWEIMAVIPLAIAVATVISGGFYIKVLKHNLGFFRFWSREWPLLGADPLRESPLYGLKDYKGSTRQFEPGAKNFLKRFLSLFVGNYAPAVSLSFFILAFLRPDGVEVDFVLAWLGAGISFAVLTVMVPALRGLGFGNLYLYNAAFPACLCLGIISVQSSQASGIVALLFIVNIVVLIRSFRHLGNQKGLTVPGEVIDGIARCGEGAWLSYPMQLMEHIACLADKPVLWGGHGDRLLILGQVYPVLRKPFHELKKIYNLRYILVNDDYLGDFKRISVQHEIIFSSTGYHIIELT